MGKKQTPASNRDESSVARPPGSNVMRMLNVSVPAKALKQARLAAVESEMTFKSYITRLLLSAQPIAEGTENAP